MSRDIVSILLAAGAGSRFGGDKLMHPLPCATAPAMPIGLAAAINLQGVCTRRLAVLRPGDQALAALLSENGCEIIFCAQAGHGMGHSLAAGVLASADAAGWLVALADMPYIAGSSHQAVKTCLQSGASLAATQFQGQRGHPVGFARTWFVQLAALSGDQGAKAIIAQHREKLVLCPVDDPGVIFDIDCRADLQHAAARRSAGRNLPLAD